MTHVLITGGSRGIGAAAVRAFCAEGCSVSFLYEKNREAAEALAAETGSRALCCDVADPAAVQAAFAALPPVDVLINNAGISHVGLIHQITEAEWDRLFAVNVKGIYHTVSAALPAMLAVQHGVIVNISSMWGQVGASCEAAYSATKGAVIALSKALAKELAPSGIRVNVLCPGVIDTQMNSRLTEQELEALIDQTPLSRLGTAEEVAQAAVYLARAEFVTGQVLGVNGGFVI